MHWQVSWGVTIDRHRVRYRLGARSPGIPDRNLCSSGRFSASARFCLVAGICWSGIRPDSWNLRCSRLPCRLRKHISPIWLRRGVGRYHVLANRQGCRYHGDRLRLDWITAVWEAADGVPWIHNRDWCIWPLHILVLPSCPEPWYHSRSQCSRKDRWYWPEDLCNCLQRRTSRCRSIIDINCFSQTFLSMRLSGCRTSWKRYADILYWPIRLVHPASKVYRMFFRP